MGPGVCVCVLGAIIHIIHSEKRIRKCTSDHSSLSMRSVEKTSRGGSLLTLSVLI